MTEIKLRTDFTVDLVRSMGSDELICQAARVSTLGVNSGDSEKSAGLISFLMRNRHGSPFEHGAMLFRISAPIVVWREFMRHRIGFSYNEESGRYRVLEGVFYVPPHQREFVQVGKPGEYTFEKGTVDQYIMLHQELAASYERSWKAYETLLQAGIAKEVARFTLPVATYSTAYVTCNPRSLMSFLSLRTRHEGSLYPSFPQWEIAQVASMMEEHFVKLFPLTHAAFNQSGRVSP